jgi:putative transposase
MEDSSQTSLQKMSRVILALLALTGRVTMLRLASWAGKGGSYRIIQRLYNTAIPGEQVLWQFFSQHLFQRGSVYILVGDESVVSKAGKKTSGLDHFISGI